MPLLRETDFTPVGLDTGFYAGGGLYPEDAQDKEFIHKDIRNITADDLDGIHAVIHLAELSNDPLGQVAPKVTEKINFAGAIHLASLAKEVGIKRFIYMSSCSVYGIAEGIVDEQSKVSPQTAYAKCKVMVEEELKRLSDDNFSFIALRSATVYGASPQQRFDTAINNLSGLAWTTNVIALNSDGSPWRPFIHIEDVSRFLIYLLDCDKNTMHQKIVNLGKTEHNYQIKTVAEAIGERFSDCQVSFGASDPDNRSYQVNCDKLAELFPDFIFNWDLEKGVKQLWDLFSKIDMKDDDFNSRYYTRLKSLEYLVANNKIDSEFFWL